MIPCGDQKYLASRLVLHYYFPSPLIPAKGQPRRYDLPRLPRARLPPFAQTHLFGFRRCSHRQPSLALLFLRSALSFSRHSSLHSVFRSLQDLRQSRTQAHRSRTRRRFFRAPETPARISGLPLHPLPQQVFLHSSSEQTVRRRSAAPHRQLDLSMHLRDKPAVSRYNEFCASSAVSGRIRHSIQLIFLLFGDIV